MALETCLRCGSRHRDSVDNRHGFPLTWLAFHPVEAGGWARHTVRIGRHRHSDTEQRSVGGHRLLSACSAMRLAIVEDRHLNAIGARRTYRCCYPCCSVCSAALLPLNMQQPRQPRAPCTVERVVRSTVRRCASGNTVLGDAMRAPAPSFLRPGNASKPN